MKLLQLNYFTAVVDAGSISKAAVALSVAQPGISQQLRLLEEELGGILFYRHGRGIELTAEGRKFYDRIVPVLYQLEQIKSDFASNSGVAIGTVTLGMPPSVAARVGFSIMTEFKDACPDASLVIIEGFSGYINELLLDSRIDAAILNKAVRAPNIAVDKLTDEPLHLVCHRLLAVKQAVDVNAETIPFHSIGEMPLVMPSSTHGLRKTVAHQESITGIQMNIIAEADSLPVIQNFLQSQQAATIIPISAMRQVDRYPNIISLRIVEPDMNNELMLGTSLHKPVTYAVRVLIEILHRLMLHEASV